ncbi:MAG: hypothetical protein QNJ58_22695 [Desulfobacterales bacterium]|nr:hypothetical protein [Desulfobacterales bacterium]
MKAQRSMVGCIIILFLLVAGGCCRIPAYESAFWNDAGTIQYDNNCYNYGNNKRTDTFAQPGRRSGDYPNPMECTEVAAAAVSDGLDILPASGVCPDDKVKVALFVDPDEPQKDYHWYRLDSDGMWSHKPGGTEATNLDQSGNPITNPETADRNNPVWDLNYTDFCGYFCSCSSRSQGNGYEDID